MRVIPFILFAYLLISKAQADTVLPVWQAHCRDRHPVIYFENEQCKGPGALVINQVINRLGHQINWSNVPWARTIKVAETGQVDLIPIHSMTSERSQFLHPMLLGYNRRYVHYYALSTSPIHVTHFEELKPYVIGAIRGTFYSHQFNNYKSQLKVTFVNNHQQLIKMLKAGRIDLAITSELNELHTFAGNAQFKAMDYTDISLNGRFFSIPRQSPLHKYAKQVELIVDDMRSSGEITRLFESYDVDPPINQHDLATTSN
ncbi:substrate-binding periplasmic protein [Shewanella sp. HN-41]|uniref:substrate-binding periplasmic protein n=1 Tax=Shewanella sp. HN-41 TaxID=327275 RepID=UPI00021262EB|nr:transporter substrate-binding domain-containing protein [Shewanella sp. HN-41]EGM68538.1 ABC-type amino acid transport/signal transduction system periplasmic component [Shewanella sp. HN-41]